MHAFSWNKFRYIGDYLHDVAVVFFLCCLNAKSLNWGTAKDIYIYSLVLAVYIMYCIYIQYTYLIYCIYIYSILLSKSSLKGASFAKTFLFFFWDGENMYFLAKERRIMFLVIVYLESMLARKGRTDTAKPWLLFFPSPCTCCEPVSEFYIAIYVGAKGALLLKAKCLACTGWEASP